MVVEGRDVLLVGAVVVSQDAGDSTVWLQSCVQQILVGSMKVFSQEERESRARAYIGPVVSQSVRGL